MSSVERIEMPEITKDAGGRVTAVRFAFGPHYFVEVELEAGNTMFYFGSTHHGVRADASEVMGELERFIEELKAAHPANVF